MLRCSMRIARGFYWNAPGVTVTKNLSSPPSANGFFQALSPGTHVIGAFLAANSAPVGSPARAETGNDV